MSCCVDVVKFVWTWTHGQLSFSARVTEKERVKMRINEEQSVVGTLKPVTAHGNPAPIDGIPIWELDKFGPNSEEVATLTATGMTATITGLPLPDGELSRTVGGRVRFDADLGEGMREVVAIFEITVAQAEAVSGAVEFGEPT